MKTFVFDQIYYCTLSLSSSSQHSVFFRPGIDEALKTGLSPCFRCLVKSCKTLKATPPRAAMANKLIMAISPINKSAMDQTISTDAIDPKITMQSTSTRYVVNHA